MRPCLHLRNTFAAQAGDSPLQMGPKLEASGKRRSNPLAFLGRFVLGTLAGSYYFLLPIYMWLKNLLWPKSGKLLGLLEF